MTNCLMQETTFSLKTEVGEDKDDKLHKEEGAPTSIIAYLILLRDVSNKASHDVCSHKKLFKLRPPLSKRAIFWKVGEVETIFLDSLDMKRNITFKVEFLCSLFYPYVEWPRWSDSLCLYIVRS